MRDTSAIYGMSVFSRPRAFIPGLTGHEAVNNGRPRRLAYCNHSVLPCPPLFRCTIMANALLFVGVIYGSILIVHPSVRFLATFVTTVSALRDKGRNVRWSRRCYRVN